MIFVPQSRSSLSKIVRGLAAGFYHAPRIEIPEMLWESFDRRAPADVIKTVRQWGNSLHLNEIVLGSNYILYDGPGDFQLILRSDLFENHGFHEGMLLGWHVDSNIAKRMYIKYSKVGDLGNKVYGYHCDHTRQITPMHSHTRLQNDWRVFCDAVEKSDLPEQADTWGLANDLIEEVRLASDPGRAYVKVLRDTVGDPLSVAPIVEYTGETYNKVDYDPRHLLPFLADMFASMPRTTNVGWYGAKDQTLRLFAGIWQQLNFIGHILLDQPLARGEPAIAIRRVSTAEALADADVFLFDFGGLAPASHRSAAIDLVSDELRRSFRRVVREERRRMKIGLPPRRMIALNAINNEYEGFVCGAVGAAATPFATHMRHGFTLPASAKENWLPLLALSDAGLRVGNQIRNDPSKRGWIAHKPNAFLDQGQYLVSMEIEVLADESDRSKNEACIVIEVIAGPDLLGVHVLRRWQLKATDHSFTFFVSESVADGIAAIEMRIGVLSPIAIALRALTVEAASELNGTVPAAVTMGDLLRADDWLPFLHIGPLGHADELGVKAESGAPGFVIYGPYWSLPAGKYEMIAHFETDHNPTAPQSLIRADVVVGDGPIVFGSFPIDKLPYDKKSETSVLRLPFELFSEASTQRQIETRIWSSGGSCFRIQSLSVKPLEPRQQDILFPSLLIGDTGNRSHSEICNFDQPISFVGHEQTIPLLPGSYRLTLQITTQMSGQGLQYEKSCLILIVKQAHDILATLAISSETNKSRNHALLFDVAGDADEVASVELHMRVVTGANVTLHNLTVEPTKPEFRQTGLAVCGLENWLPFLERRGREDHDGLVVGEGHTEWVIFGPYWTLPAGHYEMIASVVPPESNANGKPLVTMDVSADRGNRQLAMCQWHLGRFKSADPQRAVELRLPFTVAPNLPVESRTIETRVCTSGDPSFRVRSVSVRVRGGEVEDDWFPNLVVGKNGIHTGGEIKYIAGRSGYIAETPAMWMAPGHYRVTADVDDASGGDAASSRGGFALEIWSGSRLIGIGFYRARKTVPLEFDVAEGVARDDVELRIRAMTSDTALTIRGLLVVKTSDRPTTATPRIKASSLLRALSSPTTAKLLVGALSSQMAANTLVRALSSPTTAKLLVRALSSPKTVKILAGARSSPLAAKMLVGARSSPLAVKILRQIRGELDKLQ